MSGKIDLEIEAIKTILKALQGLDEDVLKNVMEYVMKRIDFTPSVGSPAIRPLGVRKNI